MSCHKLLTATLSARGTMDLAQRSRIRSEPRRRVSDTHAWCGKDRLMLVNACWTDSGGTEPVIIAKRLRLILHFLLYGERFSVRALWGMAERSPLCQGQLGRNGGTVESFLKLQHSPIHPSSIHPAIYPSIRSYLIAVCLRICSLENLVAVKYFCMMSGWMNGHCFG